MARAPKNRPAQRKRGVGTCEGANSSPTTRGASKSVKSVTYLLWSFFMTFIYINIQSSRENCLNPDVLVMASQVVNPLHCKILERVHNHMYVENEMS